jgi:predicted MFS family arabinose efflux permease
VRARRWPLSGRPIAGAAFPILLALGALDAAGYSMVAPVVPGISRATGAGPALIGALVGALAAGQLVGYPLAAGGVQRRHAAAVLAAALALMVVGDLGFIVGSGLPIYVAARFVQGIGAGGLWMGVVFGVLERFPESAYLKLTGVLAAYSIGGVAGPALGALGGIRAPFAAHLMFTGAGAIAVALLWATPAAPRFGSEREALRTPGFALASAGIVLVSLCLGAFEGPLALYFGTRLSQAKIGALYVGCAVVLGASASASGRFRPWAALATGGLLLSLALPLAAATSTVSIWLVAIALLGVGFGAAEAGALGVLLETVGAERIVLAMMVWSQIWGIGYLVGPLAGGGLVEALGPAGIGVVSAIGDLAVLVAFAAVLRARRTDRLPDPA